jgi:hypothetical protein
VLKVDDKNTLKVKLKDSLKTEKEVLEFLEKL